MVLFLHHSVMLPHHRPVTAPAAPADQGFEFLDLLFRQEGLSLFDGADAVEGDVGAFFRSPAHKLLGGGQIHFVGLERLADIKPQGPQRGPLADHSPDEIGAQFLELGDLLLVQL